jgi:hypothetical protein
MLVKQALPGRSGAQIQLLFRLFYQPEEIREINDPCDIRIGPIRLQSNLVHKRGILTLR